MAYLGPSSLDLLATQGIIPYDAQAFITGEPSPYLEQCGIRTPRSPELASVPPLKQQPIADSYNPAALMKEEAPEKTGLWRKIGVAALGTYILGFICSKGKKNPVEGLKAIYNLGAGAVKKIGKIFKKS